VSGPLDKSGPNRCVRSDEEAEAALTFEGLMIGLAK